jgi:hypothetical protein
MSSPLRKTELETLERIARGQSDPSLADEATLARLTTLGLIDTRSNRTAITPRGTMTLTRRKALLRSHSGR